MSQIAFLGALELGLIYGLVALGVFLSFRVLNFPDLTVDGSFPLGAAVASSAIVAGLDPYLGTLMALLAGALAGLVTAILNVRFGILHLLASILTMIALFSINLRIMGRPNIALLTEPTVLTPLEPLGLWMPVLKVLAMGAVALVAALLLVRFLASDYGLAMRATGANPRMARPRACRPARQSWSGMALSNALVALGGALFAQTAGFADISIGTGTIVVGLAAVIVGETILPSRHLGLVVLACLLRLDPLSPRRRARAELGRARAHGLGPEPRDRRAGGSRADPAERAQPGEGAADAADGAVIRLHDLKVVFAPGTVLETTALCGVDLALPAGQFVTVIGSNGAGKSTLLNAITGNVGLAAGRIEIDGQDVTGWSAPARAALMAAFSRTRSPAAARRSRSRRTSRWRRHAAAGAGSAPRCARTFARLFGRALRASGSASSAALAIAWACSPAASARS